MTSLIEVLIQLFFLLLDPNNPVAPPTMPSHSLANAYVISPQRLAEIRSYFMYWYFDKDYYGGRGDYQFDIHASTTQIHKNLNFQLPFFGFRFNYTRVSKVKVFEGNF